MIIYLHRYRKTRTVSSSPMPHPRDRDYVSAELIARLGSLFCYRRPADLTAHLPDDAADINADNFLVRVRMLAAHV